MAALERRRVRTTQPLPGQALLIDWENPITSGMVLATSNADQGYGYAKEGLTSYPYVGANQVVTPQGTGGRSTSASNYLYRVGAHGLLTNSYSLFAFGTVTSTSVTQNALDMDDGTTRYFQLRVANGQMQMIPFDSGGNAVVVAVSPNLTLSDMSLGFAMGATVSPSRATAWANDTMAAGAPVSGNFVSPTQSAPLYIGARANGSLGWATGGLMLTVAWNRTLTDSEMRSMIANPWQIFKPMMRRVLMPLIPAIFNMTPGPASFALTGSAPTVQQSANIELSPGAASFTLAGSAPTIQMSANVDLSPGAATFTMGGLAPALQRTDSVFLSPAPSSFNLAGYAPAIAQSTDTVLFPGPASFALTGYAPVLDQATNKDLTPGAGSLALTCFAPSVTQAPMPADPRYARPIGDVSAGTWQASDGGALSAAVDRDDDITMSAAAPGVCEIKLAPVVDPQTSSGQIVRYKAASNNGSGLTVRLKQGATIIAQWTHDSLPAVDTVFTQSLTAMQCDSITDYGDLRFEFEAL